MNIFVTLGEKIIALTPQKDFWAGHGLVRVTVTYATRYRIRLNSHVISCAEKVGASVAVVADGRKTVLVVYVWEENCPCCIRKVHC